MKLARLALLGFVAACASERKPETLRSGAPPLREASAEPETKNPESPPAETTATQAAPAAQGQPESDDLVQAQALLDESVAALKASDYDTARANAAKAVKSLLANPRAEQDAHWLKLLDGAGQAAEDAQDPSSAKVAWERVLECRLRTLPDDHPDVQEARLNLATAIKELGDLKSARTLGEKVLEVFSRTLPDDHPELQRARFNLAATIGDLGDLQGERLLEEKVLEVLARTLPDDHPSLQLVRGNLATTIQALGDVQGARILKEKVLEVLSRTLPDQHPALQRARLNLATARQAMGDYRGAQALEEKALEVFSETVPEENRQFQAARFNLAVTIQTLGDLQRALDLEKKVLEVRTRALPDDHPDLQATRQSLACTMYLLGDFGGARALFEKVLEIRSHMLPDDHPDMQAARGNLAETIKALGDLRGARELEEKVLEIRSRTLPNDHPDLQASWQNLGGTLLGLGDLPGAHMLFERVLKARAATLPDEHPDLQTARGNVAITLQAMGDLSGAEVLEQRVLESFLRTQPEDHPDVQVARMNLAVTIAAESAHAVRNEKGREESEAGRKRCVNLLMAACMSQLRSAHIALLESSSREAQTRTELLAKGLDLSLSLASGYGVFKPTPELNRPTFTLSETTRGATLVSAALMRVAASTPRYAEVRAELAHQGDEIASLAAKGTTSDRFLQALARRETIERELLTMAKDASGGEIPGLEVDADALAGSFGDYDAIVAYRRYRRLTLAMAAGDGASSPLKPVESSVDSLCAFIVHKAVPGTEGSLAPHALTLVDLGPIEPIEKAVHAWRTDLGVSPDARGIGTGRASKPGLQHDEAGKQLRNLVFDPVWDHLQGVNRIIVTLDDVLHLVPFDTLPDADAGSVLGDRLRIETRATLMELLASAPHSVALPDLTIVGGIAYDGEPQDGGTESSRPASTDTRGGPTPRPDEKAGILRGGAFATGFPDLPGTRDEAESIATVVRGASPGTTVTLLEGADATRERLMETAPKARYLHIATHGWFAPESIRSWKDPEPLDKYTGLGMRQSGEEQVRGMSPMLLCGLALAGANLPENAVGRVPGLITAEEISALDLSNCELAVLSACDTNVGERRAGQGVASLQMALQMAGARSVITSLWKVPDEATRELMVDFYRRLWVEKKPKWQALWEAKKRIREAKDERGQPKYSTRDWAAWVLTGDPN